MVKKKEGVILLIISRFVCGGGLNIPLTEVRFSSRLKGWEWRDLMKGWKKRDLKNKMWWWVDLLYPLRYVKVYSEVSFCKNMHHKESCQMICKAIKLASFCMVRALTERYFWTDLDQIWKDLREALYWI